jgi:hypothetical protein
MSFAAVPNSFALARKNLPLSPDIGMHLPPLDPLPETSITQSLVRLPVRPVCLVNSRLWRTARQPDPACSFGFWSCLRFTDGQAFCDFLHASVRLDSPQRQKLVCVRCLAVHSCSAPFPEKQWGFQG